MNELPLIQDLVDTVAGKRIYSTLDFADGFHQLEIAEEHKERTAFTAHSFGLFEFNRLGMGLCGGPSTFQKCVNGLSRELSATILIYMDDIILASDHEEDHLRDLEQLFRVLLKYNLKVKPSKCAFARTEIHYLGHIIGEDGVRPDSRNVEAVLKLSRPRSMKELRSLLGAFTYYRKFVKKFSTIMSPLYELLKGSEDIEAQWGDTHQAAMDELKKRLTSPPVLAAPRFGHPFVLETDASSIALAATLLQEGQDGQLHPISYTSRKCNKHETVEPLLNLKRLR
jgi:hypothetical protein